MNESVDLTNKQRLFEALRITLSKWDVLERAVAESDYGAEGGDVLIRYLIESVDEALEQRRTDLHPDIIDTFLVDTLADVFDFESDREVCSPVSKLVCKLYDEYVNGISVGVDVILGRSGAAAAAASEKKERKKKEKPQPDADGWTTV